MAADRHTRSATRAESPSSGTRAGMTNRRMFLTMLAGAVFRRRSRAVMAVIASLVGASTLFCLAAVCIAVPRQMREEMRAYGANLIVTPGTGAVNDGTAGTSAGTASGDSAGTASGDSAGTSSDDNAGAHSGTASGQSSNGSADDAASSSAGTTAGGAADGATSRSDGIDAADAKAVTALVESAHSAQSASYRYENVRINAAPYTLAGIDINDVRTLNQHWSIDGDWPSAGGVMVGRDVADALDTSIGSTITIAYRAADNTGAAGSQSAATGQSGSSDQSADAAQSGTSAQTNGSSSSQSDSVAGQTRDGRVSTDIMETDGIEFRVVGIVDTGGSEDEIVYATESDVAALAGGERGVDVIEYSVNADGDELTALIDMINANVGASVVAQQVTKITSSDTRIITMLQTLFWIVSLVVLVLTFVGVGTTISSIVSQRRNEIGLRKALGASSRAIGAEFYVESALYGLCGGLVGTAVGYGLARVLCVSVFDRAIGFDWWLGLASLTVSALIAVAASVPPVRRATRIDPAVVLREE